jgi:hypothetical protein
MKTAFEKSYASGAMRARLIIAILVLTFPHATGSRIFCILKLGDECILSGLQAFGAENPVKLTRFNGLKGSTTNGGTLNHQERKQQ